MNILRRSLTLLCLSVLCLGTASSAIAAGKEEKVVYHVNDSTNAMGVMRSIGNHLDASPKAKIVVVTHGGGIDFLLDSAKDKNGNPYDIPVQALAGRGVQFRVCNNTLVARKLDKNAVLPEATLVPSGVAEVSRLQLHEDFVYIKL
jgi:intracellular sulfur oxidation DsrE/DsrF family protein